MAVARHMGLFAVALLAARHGITVTLSMPPDGGTTAEVYLPAALISPAAELRAEPGGLQGRAGEARRAGASAEAGPRAAGLPFSAVRVTSRPEHPRGPEIDAPEAVPLLLGAPVPAPAPTTSTGVTDPEPVDAEPGDGPPIFESVRSGYLLAFGRDLVRFSEQQPGQSPAERPAGPPASWGEDSGRAAAGPPPAGSPASAGLPQRVPQPGQVRGAAADQVRGAAADQEPPQAAVTDSAAITWRKLASFQRGSRRARAEAQKNRSANQPRQDG
jgi:hypothetical protein